MNLNLAKLLMITALISSTTAMACLPMPGSESPLANRLLVAVANKYQVNLLETKVDVKKYAHEMSWKFSDSGIDCHDTDKFSAQITLSYKDKWDQGSNCETKVQASLVSSPEVKDGEYKLDYQITELSSVCGE